jgi:hypothetical protein
MAEGLILEFAGVGVDEYRAVNAALGIDPETGAGEWPPGLTFHAGGATASGLLVFEVWESRDAQGRFMQERLGPAMQQGGITAQPSRVEWIALAGLSGGA